MIIYKRHSDSGWSQQEYECKWIQSSHTRRLSFQPCQFLEKLELEILKNIGPTLRKAKSFSNLVPEK